MRLAVLTLNDFMLLVMVLVSYRAREEEEEEEEEEGEAAEEVVVVEEEAAHARRNRRFLIGCEALVPNAVKPNELCLNCRKSNLQIKSKF